MTMLNVGDLVKSVLEIKRFYDSLNFFPFFIFYFL